MVEIDTMLGIDDVERNGGRYLVARGIEDVEKM